MNEFKEYDNYSKQMTTAKEIAEFLSKNYPNQRIEKKSIRAKYKLPWVFASEVFAILEREHGFINEHRFIIVKSSQPETSVEG